MPGQFRDGLVHGLCRGGEGMKSEGESQVRAREEISLRGVKARVWQTSTAVENFC